MLVAKKGDAVVSVKHRAVTHCPVHAERRLIRALDGEHKQQMQECRAHGRQAPFECAHATMPFWHVREKPCDVEAGFYVCPECTFSVCFNCAELKGKAKLAKELAEPNIKVDSVGFKFFAQYCLKKRGKCVHSL